METQLTCFKCHKKTNCTFLMHHLKLFHKIDQSSLYFECIEKNCTKVFNNYRCFQHHITNQHVKKNANVCRTVTFKKKNVTVQNKSDTSVHKKRYESSSSIVHKFQMSATLYTSKFYADPILVRKTVQDIVDETTNLFNCNAILELKEQIAKDYNDMEASEEQFQHLVDLFSILQNPFQNLKTEHLRIKHFKLLGGYVEPIEFIIGNNGKVVKVYFVLTLMIGDNLGLNEILGFVASFSKANYPCRLCKVHINDLKTMTKENELLLRNPNNYEEDKNVLNYSQTGIKSECIFNSIPSFHVTNNYVFDTMHDVLEGTCCYVFPVIMSHLVKSNFITLAALNFRIEYFDYGPIDIKNKPIVITSDSIKNGYLKMSASEMAALVHSFCLMVGDLIPRNDPFWELCCLQREMIALLTSKYFQKETVEYIDHVITKHHELYLVLSKKHLTFKFHNLIHAARIIKMSGPPSGYSTMRCEGKHGVFKKYLSNVFCRINTPLTAAMKHQLVENHRYLTNSSSESLVLGPGVIEKTVEIAPGIAKLPKSLLPQCIVSTWYKQGGYTYKKNNIVIINVNCYSLPRFGQIEYVLTDSNNISHVFLSCVNVVLFDYHFQSYEVLKTSEKIVMHIADLMVYPPLQLNTSPNGNTYVSVPYSL